MSVDRNDKRRSGPEEPTSVAFPRRRLGRVEHDSCGNARMEWAPLPETAATSDRVVLEILDEPGGGNPLATAARPSRGGFQPYGNGHLAPPPSAPPRKPKDLRKLGEWLKMTRELEEQRKRDETG